VLTDPTPALADCARSCRGARDAMRAQSALFTPCLRPIPQARSLDTLAAPARSSPIHRADRRADRRAALAPANDDHPVREARANLARVVGGTRVSPTLARRFAVACGVAPSGDSRAHSAHEL